MSVIRVAHVTTAPMSLRYLLLNQLLSIQADGYEVVGISAPGPEVPEVEGAGIRHVAVPMTRNFTQWHDLITFWRLYRVMRRERFTIVHTHTPKPGLLGQLAARLAGVPIVINTLHGFYFHDHMRPFWRRFYIMTEKIAARCSDVILSQNSEDVETAVREKICQRESIKRLGNGIDVRRFDRRQVDPAAVAQTRYALGLPDEALVVGFVGRLVEEKGILELLQAMQTVTAQVPNVRVLIVGPIDYEKLDVLKPEIAQRYGLADICIFTGKREDMPELYAQMNVFVLPSHREGFPRAPMEASAMGVPCVVSDIRGCREAVLPECNGLLVPLHDVPALAQAILGLLTDRKKAHCMGIEGRRLAEERFDEQLVFSTVKAEYARLLRAKHLPVPQATGR
jgi:glycosyltransferase involved in cell wall biosynthesis